MPWNVWDLNGKSWLLIRSVASKAHAEAAIRDQFSQYVGAVEARQVRPHLELHGTTLMQFKPEAIWRMAMDDFNRRNDNASASSVDEMKSYHFHRDHVRKASTANDILRAAIADPDRGRESGKKITRLLYGDVEQLRKALQ